MSAEPSRHPNKTCSQTLQKKNTEQSNWYMHPALFLTGITLPETNITPTRKPSQKENCFPTIHFHALCQFQGGYFEKECSYFYWHGAFWNDWRGALWLKLKKTIAEAKKISRQSQLKHICTARYKYVYINIYRHMYECFMIEKINILQMMFIDTTHTYNVHLFAFY